MRTIDEESERYSICASTDMQQSVDDNGEYDFEEFIRDAVAHGVEFAQQWVPVGQELPEDESERYGGPGTILCSGIVETMNIDFPRHVQSAYYNFGTGAWRSVITLKEIRPTHWRPVELK